MAAAAGGGGRILKLVLCGNGSVGKSSLVARFVADGFSKVYKQTVGLEFFERSVTLRGTTSLTLRLVDIGGQSIASKMLDKYLGDADVVFLVYDVTDSKSFADIEDWLAKARAAAAKRGAAPSVFLAGNKADLLHSRQVSESAHDKLIDDHGLNGGFFVSAANGDRVLRSFYAAAGQAAGVPLSDDELALYDTVVGVTTTRTASSKQTDQADSTLTEEQQAAIDRIAKEDAEAERAMEARMQREAERPDGCCACS